VTAGISFPKFTSPERIIDIILYAERLLRNSRITDTPRLDAEVLLADLLGVNRAKLAASYFDQLREPERSEYLSRISRRVREEPVSYIIGKKEFMGFLFHVDRRALIPRPETETLVEHTLEMVTAGECGGKTILDVGTGSGCIAISLALSLPRARICATDISANAVELARHNAELHRVDDRITFYVGNVYSALPDASRGSFDLIVSNPPYVSDAEFLELDRGITDFEPAGALRGGSDGTEVFRQIAAGAVEYLAPRGALAVEIGESQAEPTVEILKHTAGILVEEIVHDLAGKPRVITGRKIQ
jgi:release factor glutamine methyltransferase